MDEQHGSSKSELKFLERLSIEELETLLRFSGDSADVETLFDTVVEEVVAREEKNPTGRLPDVDTLWNEFQMMYGITLDRDASLGEKAGLPSVGHDQGPMAAQAKEKPRRISLLRVAHVAAAIAATVVLSLALMVGAQAAGADVFGALARWTDDTFHFETWSAEPTYCEALHDTIQETLDAQGILGEFVPTWYPEGYDIVSIKTSEDVLGSSIEISLANDFGDGFFIRVEQYEHSDYVDLQVFETNTDSVEEYISNGKIYYIFSNKDSVTAAWSDGTILQRIWGELTLQEFKTILDSIGG